MEKDTNIKSKMLFKIFGWRVYVSNKPMKARERHTKLRDKAKKDNLELAGHKCQWCGKEITTKRYCVMKSKLDNTHHPAERYKFDNVEILCLDCNRAYQNQKRNELQQEAV